MNKKVAFLGLGNMGGGMAANLVKAGFDVHAFDLSATAVEAAKASGCLIAENAATAVVDCDFVVSMLPNGQIVKTFISIKKNC